MLAVRTDSMQNGSEFSNVFKGLLFQSRKKLGLCGKVFTYYQTTKF